MCHFSFEDLRVICSTDICKLRSLDLISRNIQVPSSQLSNVSMVYYLFILFHIPIGQF
jgi:hypothetical protein